MKTFLDKRNEEIKKQLERTQTAFENYKKKVKENNK